MRNFWDKRIPTTLGLLVITFGIFLTTFLVKGESLFEIRAGPGSDPENVEITNISGSSFTVSYSTDKEVIGIISFGEDPKALERVALDDRDELSQAVKKYSAHLITAKNLNPNTTYYFSITSADKKYLDNGSPYSLETGDIISKNPSFQKPISGKVILPDGSAPEEGLVYISVNGSQKLSTYLKNDGNYLIPLNNLRNASLSDYFILDKNSIINIEIFSENLFSSISTSLNQVSPVPLTTLSKSYDFSTLGGKNNSRNDGSVSFPSVGKEKQNSPTPTL